MVSQFLDFRIIFCFIYLIFLELLSKQETPLVFTKGVFIRFGTDLLSHMLLQYHRLWRA